jgi:hypothetical protein
MKNNFKKIITLSTFILIFINPVLSVASDPVPNNNNNTNSNPYNPNIDVSAVNAQIQNSIQTTQVPQSQQNSTAQTNSVASGATGIASCLGSQIVSQAIVQNVNSFASTAIGKVTDSIMNVPVAEGGSTGAAIKTDTSARVGSGISLFGFSIPTLPSWDAMAYCIVNTMIIYIADSTIQWVNTGFEGNPAFLNNPDQFFEDLANQEKTAFLQGLAYGINSSVCGVYKSSVVSAVLSRYGKNQQMYGQQGYQTGGYGGGYSGGPVNSCPFDQDPGRLNAFLTGSFSQGGGWDTWFEITQNPMSNPYDTYFNAVDNMNSRVESIQLSKERELTWNNGYLSFRKCENGERDTSKCPITTPGSIVQNQLETTLNLGKNRLVLADKFDQVVTAVVDQLITTALDKALSRDPYNSQGQTNSEVYENLWNSTNTDPYTGINQNNNTNSSSTNFVQ